MSAEVRLRPVARVEFDEGADWYNERRAGQGVSFIGAVDAAITEIANAPNRYPVVHESIRVHSVKGFPYQVFYRELEDHVVEVLAIFHVRRDPKIWQER